MTLRIPESDGESPIPFPTLPNKLHDDDGQHDEALHHFLRYPEEDDQQVPEAPEEEDAEPHANPRHRGEQHPRHLEDDVEQNHRTSTSIQHRVWPWPIAAGSMFASTVFQLT